MKWMSLVKYMWKTAATYTQARTGLGLVWAHDPVVKIQELGLYLSWYLPSIPEALSPILSIT